MFIRKPLYLMADEGGDGGASGGSEGTPAGAPSADSGQAAPPGAEGQGDGKKADDGKTFTQADVDRIIQGRLSKYADYDDLKKQVDEARQANLSEQERAVEEARNEARAETSREFGKRLATSEIKAAAADASADLAGVFDYLDLTRFVGDNGEPDEAAIKAFVDGLPKKNVGTPSYDGGSRTPAPPTQDMNTFLRKATGRA